uniref:RING-CH-type domain-containing protein n=1 Tax=Ditylenchus dipsaci TaxID=166011 RepID=A0A915DP19_9BILA
MTSPTSRLCVSQSAAVCRICYSGENSGLKEEPLISPCNCKGTMGLFHRSCLNEWLMSSNTFACEICRFRFDIRRIRRPFGAYLRASNAVTERQTLITDILCFLVLTPLVILSVIVCVSLAVDFIDDDKEEPTKGLPKVEICLGLLSLSFVLLLAYGIWLSATLHFHRKSFKLWQEQNSGAEVVDQLSLEESILVTSVVPNPVEWVLLLWLSGNLVSELSNVGGGSGLGIVKARFLTIH